MIALGRGLRARGHEVTLQTWRRWQTNVEAEGMTFAPAPEYDAFPSILDRSDHRSGGSPDGESLDFYEAVVHATVDTVPLVRELRPDVVVADILTLAPALAAELAGIPKATLIPHVYPENEPAAPIYSLGARLPRTKTGRGLWRVAQGPVKRGVERGRIELNATRARLGLPALAYGHGGTSRELALVATFPQLEYPRAWPPWAHVVGPLMWEPPYGEVELPGDGRRRDDRRDPLVLVAPSTAQDPGHELLKAALKGLADAPVRVLASWNRRLPPRALSVPENAKIVEWVSYAKTMPKCDAVVCHAGHGTLVRALASGCAVVACPHTGDMNENAARLDWAGAGVRLPRRFVSPRPLRLAVERALGEPTIRARASELSAWTESHDAADMAAGLVERLGATGRAQRVGARP